MNLYGFVGNVPSGQLDYLGLDGRRVLITTAMLRHGGANIVLIVSCCAGVEPPEWYNRSKPDEKGCCIYKINPIIAELQTREAISAQARRVLKHGDDPKDHYRINEIAAREALQHKIRNAPGTKLMVPAGCQLIKLLYADPLERHHIERVIIIHETVFEEEQLKIVPARPQIDHPRPGQDLPKPEMPEVPHGGEPPPLPDLQNDDYGDGGDFGN